MATEKLPSPGTAVEDIDTPAMIVDLDVAEANIRDMQRVVAAGGSAMRPHTKTTKSPYWALKMIDAGAIGVCCAKVGEAEVLVEGGVSDILITSEIVGASKIARLVSLAKNASIKVVVDNAENARDISDAARAAGSTVGVLVDVNIRLNRCGVEPGEATTSLAKIVDSLPGLRFDGLNGYEGHIYEIGDARIPETLQALEKLQYAVTEVKRAGLPVDTVSAGGTSTYDITSKVPEVTEIQAGSYIFMDGAYVDQQIPFSPALTIVTQVISRPAADRAILDVGLKSIANDYGLPRVVGTPGAQFTKLSEEHGTLALEGAARDLELGDVVHLMPSHTGTTINLHDYYFCVREGVLEEVVEVAGRGKFR
ncbi:MAG: DSD1 family PLP-dependent enzyme [Verrucomicrobia bacterium]|nr:DSD1 family PLP-dependent enzyme [Verrucomicrobiota bacterium]